MLLYPQYKGGMKMRIKSFTIINYRSIIDAYEVPLSNGLTVLVGKNNEGKSNILRALNGAFSVIRQLKEETSETYFHRLARLMYKAKGSEGWFYDWETDFPISKQLSKRNKETDTVFKLLFSLNESERAEFYERIGSNCNEDLPFQITFNKESFKIYIPKKSYAGKGKFNDKQAEIASFISEKLDTIYIPAIRTSDLSVEIISEIVNKEIVSNLENNTEYKKALEIIKKQQEKAIYNAEQRLTGELKKFIPNLKSIEINGKTSRKYANGNMSLGTSSINIDDGVKTPIDYKGDGLKSLVALGVMKAAKQGNLTIAIEEPESHLHPEAIRKIRQVIEEISTKNQIIITTHSPIMINRDKIETNIIIAKNSAKPSKNIKMIRDELGIIVADNLSNATRVILVEGISDKNSIEAILKCKSSKIKKAIQNGELVIEPLCGTSHLKQRVSRLSDDFYKILVLLDDDQAGRQAAEQAKQIRLLDDKSIFFTVTNSKNESEFEDLLKPEIYTDYIKREFGIDIPKNFSSQKGKKWSSRLDALFSANMKRLTDKNLEEIKIHISELVKSNAEDVIRQDIKIFENFIKLIEDEFLV